jgi:tRNA (mo5U34)-methyltransferase
VRALGSWFHNLRLGESGEVQTAPDHFLGDFPATFWRQFQHVVPQDLTGKTVLDIGCNAGFYSFEMKRRGASNVLGIDHDAAYLRQAEFAKHHLAFGDVEFRQMEVYDVDALTGKQFDLVLFMGVFYHLRHPLYALEKVAKLVDGILLFQTMERGSSHVRQISENYPFDERDVFLDDGFPRLHFIEHRYADDPTNWWIPNAAGSMSMLRSVGLRVLDRPCQEVYLCERDDRRPTDYNAEIARS